jgi:hypothetical protein
MMGINLYTMISNIVELKCLMLNHVFRHVYYFLDVNPDVSRDVSRECKKCHFREHRF